MPEVFQLSPAPLQLLEAPWLREAGIELYIKREDLLHSQISGNKWRKLKYNIEAARAGNHHTLLTFGGAFSNHIYSVAAAGKLFNFNTIGVIRGEEHLPLNHTLSFAQACGMQLVYIDREMYRNKKAPSVEAQLRHAHGDFYLIPEGGSNTLAVKGCSEIVADIQIPFDVICTACGTGGTLAGLVEGLGGKAYAIGFSALKGGSFLYDDVRQLLHDAGLPIYSNWHIETEYHMGGYAKQSPQLFAFIHDFHHQFGIILEPIYTGKMMWGLFDKIKKGDFAKGTRIVALHTGGVR